MSENFCYAHPHPAVATDVVIFTVRDERLELLLIKRANDPFRGIWALPGGFLDIDEDLEACARRELEEETGLSGLYMEQLYTFSDPGVMAALSDSLLLKTDVTANDDIDVELMSSLGIYGPPAILFFDKNGNELRNRRVVGFMEADDFVNHINTTF